MQFYLDPTSPAQYIFVLAVTIVLIMLSILAWRELFLRAYKFRKNACDVIRDNVGISKPAASKNEEEVVA